MSNDVKTSATDVGTELAMTRTILALDRTMLAWIRTSIALLGFGFTFAKYLHAFVQHTMLKELHLDSPRSLGFILMLLGISGIAGGIVQYFMAHRRLKVIAPISIWSPSLLLAIGILVAGTVLTIRIGMQID